METKSLPAQAIITGVDHFYKAFDPGKLCPRCAGKAKLLATTNEWKYHCPACDCRFDEQNEIF